MIAEEDKNKTPAEENRSVPAAMIPVIIFDFYCTLSKIKKMEKVIKISCSEKLTDIFIVLENDDIEMSEKIIDEFAQWEADYKVFPELHVINQNELFYIPAGSFDFNG